ncbi:MAG: hypothetical protein CMM16_03640 [Rhodospirillaceae bacterium]|nr:hypothetical protein [Rhodospirillaceae bacterium]
MCSRRPAYCLSFKFVAAQRYSAMRGKAIPRLRRDGRARFEFLIFRSALSPALNRTLFADPRALIKTIAE